MATRPARRPLISLQAHLQSLLLTTSLDSTSSGTSFGAQNVAGPSNLSQAPGVDYTQDNLQQLGPIIKSLDEAAQADAFLRLLREFAKTEEARIKTICDENSTVSLPKVETLSCCHLPRSR